MGFLARLILRNGNSNSLFAAVRMSKHGHHYYTILASDSGFEFVFQNGKDQWSTISPTLAVRLIEKNREGKMGVQPATNRKQFLELAIGSSGSVSSSWMPSKEVMYTTREQALAAEREILDISWASAKEELENE